MRLFQISIIAFFFIGCESDEGKNLGQKYCKCLTEAKGDIYMVGECEEEFKEEIESLEQKPRLYQDFMDEMENCQ